MAFPTSDPLARALLSAQDAARSLKSLAQDTRALMAAGNTSANLTLQMLDTLVRARGILQAAKNTPGIGAYAQAQYDNVGIDIAAEFTAMVAAIDAAGAQIMSSFPKDAAGYLLQQQFAVDGTLSVRTFTPAQTATLRARLDDLVATIG